MRHFSVVNVKNLYLNRDEFESTSELAAHPGVIQMFEALFEDPNRFAEAIVEGGYATPAECRLVADFFAAFLGTVDSQPENVLLANWNEELLYLVHFN